MHPVFKISDFSKLSQVSMRTLRYYDEMGLLKPQFVDASSGYRYYLADQLTRLQRILALKDLGFELAQIALVLDEELPPEQLRGMLRLKHIEIQQRVQVEQDRLARIDAHLKQLEPGITRPTHEIVLKKGRSHIVASTRAIVNTTAQWAQRQQLATTMLATLKKYGVRQIDHLLFIDSSPLETVEDPAMERSSLSHEQESSIVEIVVPIQSSSIGTIVEHSLGRITIRELPAISTLATLLYHGSPYTLSEAYQTLGTWISAHDYIITGPCHLVCIQREGELDTYITEIQFPVEKRATPSTTRAQSFAHIDKHTQSASLPSRSD
jgi:DNA-binding transcriptional MerR regulator